MDIQIGQRVRISEHAYPGSDEPDDVECRGQLAIVVEGMFVQIGPEWGNCAIVRTADGCKHYVMIDELKPLTAEED